MGLTLRGGMRVLQRFREHQGRRCSLSLPQDSFIQEICSCITVHKDKHTRSESTSTYIPKAQLKHSSWNKKSPYSTPETREDIGNKAGFLPSHLFIFISKPQTLKDIHFHSGLSLTWRVPLCWKGSAQNLQTHHWKGHHIVVSNRLWFHGNPDHV